MGLMFAICRPQPNWMPRKPKLMFQICQKERRGLVMVMRVVSRMKLESLTRHHRIFVPVELSGRSCHTPAANMKLSPDQSLAGILEPVFAIRTENDLGVGDTDGVRQMIDWCHRHHLNIFQTLPINETSDDNSPYNAISSLAIEPSTLAVTPKQLPDLSPKRFNEIARPEVLQELHVGRVNYPQVKALKRKLLEVAFESFLKKHFNQETERATEFRAFMKENA